MSPSAPRACDLQLAHPAPSTPGFGASADCASGAGPVSARGAGPVPARGAGPVLAVAGLALALAGCANSPAPNRYQDLASSAQLQPGATPRTAFSHEPAPGELSRYRAVHLLPVEIYRGADHQFGTLTAADRASLAAAAGQEFRSAFAREGLLAPGGDATTLDLKITLTGGQASVPVLATATRVTPVGFALSGLSAATGGEGRFSGVVIYAVEFRDRATGRIVWAFIAKRYANALNIAATFGPLDAAKEGLKEGAQELATATARRLRGG